MPRHDPAATLIHAADSTPERRQTATETTPGSEGGLVNGSYRTRNAHAGIAAAAMLAAMKRVMVRDDAPMNPASMGPTSNPMPFVTFMSARAETAGRAERTTRVCAPVKK